MLDDVTKAKERFYKLRDAETEYLKQAGWRENHPDCWIAPEGPLYKATPLPFGLSRQPAIFLQKDADLTLLTQHRGVIMDDVIHHAGIPEREE